MSKFLDNIGLGHLIDLIKTALSEKQNTLVSGTNIRTINGTSILGSDSISIGSDGIFGNYISHLTTCLTAANTAAKIATINMGTISSLNNGLRVTVYFSNRNTADNPTLNINSKGAKNIYYNGSQITTGANKGLLYGMVDLVYYSNRWNIVGFIEAGVTAQETLVSGTNIKTINSTSLLGSGDVAVQPTLVSGTNIKTINNESILGSGNITISGGISGTGVTAIVALTESEYDALATKDSTTLYIVTPDQIPYDGNYIKISWGHKGEFVYIGNDSGTILEIGENINISTIVENPPVIIKPDGSIMDFSGYPLTPHYQQNTNTLSFNNGSTYFDLHLNNGTWDTYFD